MHHFFMKKSHRTLTKYTLQTYFSKKSIYYTDIVLIKGKRERGLKVFLILHFPFSHHSTTGQPLTPQI